jgi:glycosyltransferase involved in cell wall biosynthesis
MNIVFLAPFAFSPKATVSARMLPMATALVRRGHHVTILIPPYDNPADSGKVWEHAGVRLENAHLRRASNVMRQYVDMARQLVDRTNEIRPDVVHVFKPVGVSALAMWHMRRSTLGSPHATFLVLDNDDWEGRGGWLDVNPYPLAQKLFMGWQETWCLRHAPIVTCASEVLVERTHQFRTNAQRDTHDSSVVLFPNGPDDAMLAQVAVARANRDALRAQFGWHQPIIIYAGTIPLNHDLDMVFSNLAGVKDLPNFRWVIIATGEGIPSLKRRIDAAGMTTRVDWHGFMPHAQLVARLVAADVAVYPYRDTNINRAKCSGKVMDYMACGLPMVLSDVGMNRVYVEHERSGLLTPPGDATAFATAIRRLVDAPDWARQLGLAAQQRIWDVFGWEGRVRALEDVYTQVPTITR